MDEAQQTVGIIGGGVAGLTAAYRLLQRGYAVRLFEAGPSLGGLVRTFEVGGEPVECFYHHLFTTDTAAVRMIHELGLGDRLAWRPSTVGVFYHDRIYPFVTPLDLLRFTPVSPWDRLRLGMMALQLRRQRHGAPFEEITAADWIRRSAGQRNLDVVWGPLLRGKFGAMAEQVVMTWLWNKVHLRFASRSGGLWQKEVLGYLLGSFGAWIDALVQRIRDLGGRLETDRPVSTVTSEAGRIALRLNGDGSPEPFDAVVATVGNRAFLRLAPQLPEDYVAKLQGIGYQDALCLVLSLKRPLTKMYWLNVSDDSIPFIAVVEHTNLVGSQRYGGEHIVYISNYLSRESPLLRMDMNQVCDLYLPHLKRINPSFEESWINGRWLFHGAEAQPVFTVGAAARIPDHRTPFPGLYLANMAQIYPQDRGQNYSILLGEKIAEIVASDLARAGAAQYQV